MTPIRVAFALLAVSACTLIDARPSAAEVYRPWCVQYFGGKDGATNCSFVSYAQCMETARGAGAYCFPNPWYSAYGPNTTGQGGRVRIR